MILSDRQIREAINNEEIIINPFYEKQVQAATYDLRVGNQGATTSTKKIIDIKKDGYLLLKPGDFAIITMFEELQLSNSYVGRFGLRSKYARKGLIATTGPQIDPGYKGKIIIGLTNLTPKPVSVPYKDDFVSVEFHKLDEPCENPYNGPYQGKTELGPEDIAMVVETESLSFSEVLTTLSSLSQNVGELASDVRMLKWIMPIIVTFGIAIIAVIVSLQG